MPGAQSVMIVGPVTWDVFPDGRRAPGGTVSFAARVASALGVRAHVLTVAASDADLTAFEGHDLHVVNAAHTLTFAHMFSPDGVRTLRLLCQPGVALTTAHIPAGWGAPDVLLVAPLVAAGVDAKAFAALPVTECGVTAQGFLREAVDGGIVSMTDAPTDALLEAATPRATVFVSEDDIARWTADDVSALATRCRRLVITHGGRGAEIRDALGSRLVSPIPAHPVDTTGAGDVFAAAFILALGEGEATAARLAAAYAAAKVEVLGPAPLPDRATIEQRLSDAQGDT